LQPQTPVRRLGKPIPTGKVSGKLLTARIHCKKPTKFTSEVKHADFPPIPPISGLRLFLDAAYDVELP
jgi:hypothetical protein